MPIPPASGLKGGRAEALMARAKEIEIIDRSYQIAAQAFVALIPLVLVVTVALTGGQQYLARSLIERFQLVGFAAQSVMDLLQSQNGHLYWSGVILSVYSAFSLSRRVSRAYTTIWRVPPLALSSQWRGLVWVGVQVMMMMLTSGLRRLAYESGPVTSVMTISTMLAVWFAAEFASQWLLTRGAVQRHRLMMAAALTAAAKLGTSIWALYYLAHSMSRQAELFGPLGVVFSIFTYMLVTAISMLVCTLVVAVLTDPQPFAPEAAPASADADSDR